MSFFFSPTKKGGPTQTTIGDGPAMQFPQSESSGGGVSSSQNQSRQRQQSRTKEELKRASSNNRRRLQNRTPSKTNRSKPVTSNDNTSMVHDTSNPQITQLGNSLNQSRTDANVGGKTTTNRRQIDSMLKLISTDSQNQGEMPQPLHSQQYKHSSSKLEMLKEQLQTQKQKQLNQSDISDNNQSATQPIISTVINEKKTTALLSLAKIMITKGKQKLELQENLNVLKDMSSRLFKQKPMSSAASQSSVGQTISPEEEMLVTQTTDRILRNVIDQWILFTHHAVKQKIKQNIAITKLFSTLERKNETTKFECILKLNAYSYKLKVKLEGKKSARSQF